MLNTVYMKKIRATILIIFALMLIGGCKKEGVDPNLPVLKLIPESVSGKSGFDTSTILTITAPNGIGKLVLSKTINLVSDENFGQVIVTPENIGENTWQYTFHYVFQDTEVNKLVGINFHFEDAKGNVAEKDLTIHTEASGAQLIYSTKWKLVSKFWTTADPPAESQNECEKDDVFSYNKDSTISINYGAEACLFDGLNVFDKWWLSEDEKTFTQVYHSVFNPEQITTEVYTVETLTPDKWVMNITLDLSVFGLSDHEVFVYTFEALE